MTKTPVIKPSIKPRLPWDHGSNVGREGTTDLSLFGSAQADDHSGLATGATGEVTLTDAANHTAIGDIGTNGTLSAVTDGIINASLSQNDLTGGSTTATANAVSPDTDDAASLAVTAGTPAPLTVATAPMVTVADGATVEIDGASAQS